MTEEILNVTMCPTTLEFCRDALARQVEATYDDPGICDRGVAHEIAFLRLCASDLGVDFDGIVSESVPVAAHQRLKKALKREAAAILEG